MSIDHKKIKRILEQADIIIIAYYLIDGDCAMIKCFLSKTFEFLIIYIPSKYRFAMSTTMGRNIYNLDMIEDNTDPDDYSKTQTKWRQR